MMVLRLIFSGFLFCFVLASCSENAEKGVFYTLTMEAEGETGTAVYGKSTFMNYKGYLFEIFYKSMFRTEITGGSRKHTEWTDSAGIALIDVGSRRYFAFDSVYPGAKVIERGRFSEKKLGLKWLDTPKVVERTLFKQQDLRDTMVLGWKMKTVSVSEMSDSQRIKNLLVILPGANFTSPLDLNLNYRENPGGPVLVSYTTVEGKAEGGGYKLREFREMTADERALCDKLIAAARLAGG